MGILGSAALSVACVVGSVRVSANQRPVVHPAARAEPGPPPAVPARYEYRTVRLIEETNISDVANAQAAQGWEIFQVVPVIQGNGGTSERSTRSSSAAKSPRKNEFLRAHRLKYRRDEAQRPDLRPSDTERRWTIPTSRSDDGGAGFPSD